MLFGLLLPIAYFASPGFSFNNNSGPITVKNAHDGEVPRNLPIEASISGHNLYVVFTDNIGQVTIEVIPVNSGNTQSSSTYTPNSLSFYIPDNGCYIFNITLSNGDEYFGEFEITD